MVLMRRKDKRRGNAEDELAVASDGSSIVANKGVRSLNSARTGRFAADMRANVGGYGRPDRTWGVDHPWHTTAHSDLRSALCARDRLEDGALAREQALEREAARGASRAALKKKKAKLKKQGLSSQEAAAVAAKEAEAARRRHEEEARAAAEEVERKRAARKEKKQRLKMEQHEADAEAAMGSDSAFAGEQKAGDGDAEGKAQSKKKLKQKLKKQQAKQKAEEQARTKATGATSATPATTPADAMEDAGEKTLTAEEEMQAREALAAQYEAALGSEITTASGLVVQDQRLGHGKLAEVGEMLTVRYRGRLGREGMVFGKGMLTTRFGTGAVIAGWEEGLGTMRPGGVRLLTIPPALGYGASGKGGKIPANATLFFEVELVRLGKRKRDAVGEDDVPLPSAFQRKRIKQKSGKKLVADDADAPAMSKSQKKRSRRKHKRPGNDDAE